MNRVALVLLCAGLALAGCWITLQAIESGKARQRIAALEQSVLEKDKALADARMELASLKMRSDVYADQIAALSKRVPASPDAGGEASKTEGVGSGKKEGKGGMGSVFSKMFDNPEMKEMMRKQQTSFLRKGYADLVKQLGMSNEQAEKFFELLGNRQMAMMEQGTALLKDGGANLEKKTADMAKTESDLSRPLEEFLGKDGYGQFKEYESGIGDRMVLDQCRLQNSSGPGAIPEEQANTLLKIMQEERKNSPQPASNNPGDPKSMEMMMSDEKMDQYFQSQEDLNARVIARAASVLSTEQLDAFEAFQRQTIEMQKMGMKMSRELMKAKE